MDSIGRYLKRTRETKAMIVEEVSRATRIPVSSIVRIEGDHFDDLPGEVFVRGFLKAYARGSPDMKRETEEAWEAVASEYARKNPRR